MSKGYHISKIEKGVLGEVSKIKEELAELEDAEAQGVKIMAAVEASDLLGALVAYTKKHLNLTLEDLTVMSKVTERAFTSGHRQSTSSKSKDLGPTNHFDIPTIDWLKANCKRIYYFGLGFIQVVVSDTERYHFYHPDLPASVEDLHTHRYDFTSYVLKGHIKNYTTEETSSGDNTLEYNIFEVSCSEDVKSNKVPRGGSLDLITLSLYSMGDCYAMYREDFHTIECMPYTITKVVRSSIMHDHALVATTKNTLTCPFIEKYEEAFLWEKIQEVIDA